MTELRDQFRTVLLRHSRSLVDQDGQPTEHLLDELVGLPEQHALELATTPEPAPERPARGGRKRAEHAAEPVTVD